MTDSTDNPAEPQVDRLNAKVRELLAENRQQKDRIRELTELDAAQKARLHRYEVEGPVERVIADVAVPGAVDAFTALLGQHFRFEAGGDGQPVIRDPQGRPIMLTALPKTRGREVEREARATVEDLRALVDLPGLRERFAAITVASRASGGGAGGSTPGGAPREPRKPAPEQRPEPKLGLR
jgi:hypothetical protein